MELIKEFRCKDLDAYISFLKRIFKIGTHYILKNDIMFALNRTTAGRPGKHIVRYPYNVNNDVIYGFNELTDILEQLDQNKEKYNKRKDILYYHTDDHIILTVNGEDIVVAVAVPDINETVKTGLALTTNFIEEIGDQSSWIELPTSELEKIKLGSVPFIETTIPHSDNILNVRTRIGKSLFKLAGVTRVTAPVDYTCYWRILPTITEEQIAQLQIHPTYQIKSGGKQLLELDCIHMYQIALY